MILNFAHHCHTAGPAMQRFPNLKQNTIPILVPLVIPETEFFDTFRIQVFCPLPIVLPLLRQSMLKAIQFNGQLCRGAIEVEIVFADLVLATKFESGKASGFKRLPELLFFVGLIATQKACNRFWNVPSPRPSPLSLLAGRGNWTRRLWVACHDYAF